MGWVTVRRWVWCGRWRGCRGVRRGRGLMPPPRCCPGRGVHGAAREPKLPVTAAAVADHAIGAVDVAVIRSVLARIRAQVPAEQRAEVKAQLAWHARTLDARQLAVLGKRILAYLDQDGPGLMMGPRRSGGYGCGTSMVAVSWRDGWIGRPPRSCGRR